MLQSFVLKVDLFAGTDIGDAARDLCTLADRIGVRVEAKFNGVTLWARPGDNPLKLVAAFHEQIRRPPAHYKIAQAD